MITFATMVWIPSLAYCFQVALRAFQQRNVTQGHLMAALPVSILMTCSQNYIICFMSNTAFTEDKIYQSVVMGLFGWVGTCIAVKLHQRIF